jgi:hypothetical protein
LPEKGARRRDGHPCLILSEVGMKGQLKKEV